MSLEAGLRAEVPFTADEPLLTDVDGALPRKVLSTPGMIGVMEYTCARLVRPHLPEGKATVGFEICIKHVGAAFEGQECMSKARLREVADSRKLRFDVEVRLGEQTIGVGTHERRLVDVSR